MQGDVSFFFNWMILYVQYRVDFCHTTMWFSHRYPYVPSLFNLPPSSHPIPPLSDVTKYQVALLCYIANSHRLICFIYSKVYVSVLLSQCIPTSPSSAVSTGLFSMSVGDSIFNDWDHRNTQKDPFPPTPKFSSLPRHPASPPIRRHHSALHLSPLLPPACVLPKQTRRRGFGWRLLLRLGLPWWLSW